MSRGPGVQTCTNVCVGDWIASGYGRDREAGRLRAYLHDDVWEVGWEQGTSSAVDISDDDVSVYDSREAAIADARGDEAQS